MKFVALAVPEIIAIEVLVGVVNPNLGVGEIIGVAGGSLPFESCDFL